MSESFEIAEKTPQLELIAVMLNVNKGHNMELLKSCRTLRDYAEYVSRVRSYAGSMPIGDAVETAMAECIAEGILEEFLSKNRAEAKKVSIYEYDEEKVFKDLKEAYKEVGWEEGRKAGMEAGREAGMKQGEAAFAKLTAKLLENSKTEELLKATEDDVYREHLYREYGIKLG